jgi:hypothetical protein
MEPDNYTRGTFEGQVLEKLDNIEKSLNTKVDRAEFTPVRHIVYGMVGLMLVAMLGALISIVVYEPIIP